MLKRPLAWPVHHPALCLLACALMVSTLAQGAPADRERAVVAAREGRYDEAISALRKLAAAGDASAALDLVVVLGWAGRHADAITAFESLPTTAPAPAWLQRAAAASYRAERRVDYRIEALQTDRVRPCRDVNGGETNGGNPPRAASRLHTRDADPVRRWVPKAGAQAPPRGCGPCRTPA